MPLYRIEATIVIRYEAEAESIAEARSNAYHDVDNNLVANVAVGEDVEIWDRKGAIKVTKLPSRGE